MKASRRQRQLQEVLMQHFAAGSGAPHLYEARGPIEPNGLVPERSEPGQVAAGTATEIEQHEGWRTLDRAEKRGVILGNVVRTRALLERLRGFIVVRER